MDLRYIKSEETGDITYVLYSTRGKPYNWLIIKIDETSSTTTLSYASHKNNSSIKATDFDTAWSNRASLSYSPYNEF